MPGAKDLLHRKKRCVDARVTTEQPALPRVLWAAQRPGTQEFQDPPRRAEMVDGA